MAISETQLRIWSQAPESNSIKHTHEEIRNVLNSSSVLNARKRGLNIDFEVYLQGSYKNSTNIRVDSDVDVVVQLNSTFYPGTSKLHPEEKKLHNQTFSDSNYSWNDFQNDVYSALSSYFGSNLVKRGDKSIKLTGRGNRIDADIVPCLQYRAWKSFSHRNQNDFVEGMMFWTLRENTKVVNFPKLHYENGKDKNGPWRTNSMYKNLVRVIKNIKHELIERNLNPNISPSYFVECMIYNIPNNLFVHNNFQASLERILGYIVCLSEYDSRQLVTGSEQQRLFGGALWQWQWRNASAFFQAVNGYYHSNPDGL